MVVLRKLGLTTRVTIPAPPDAGGPAQPDPVIAKLTEGDSVWVALSEDKEPKLLVMMPYAEPQRGKLLKVEPIEIDGKKGMSVQIDLAGATLVGLIPGSMEKGNWKSDARILASVRRCKPGNDVLFRVQDIDGKKWLREIDAAPQPVATRPAPSRGEATPTRTGFPTREFPAEVRRAWVESDSETFIAKWRSSRLRLREIATADRRAFPRRFYRR